MNDSRKNRIEDLRRQIAIGLDQVRRGDVAPLDIAEIKAEGRKRLAASNQHTLRR